MRLICRLIGHRWHTALSCGQTRCLRCGRHENRMVAQMERFGGKGFWILRSAETGIKHYHRASKEDSA